MAWMYEQVCMVGEMSGERWEWSEVIILFIFKENKKHNDPQ